MNLKNLTILVTRPKPEGEELCERIRKAEGHPIFLPTIEIVPIESTFFQDQIKTLIHFDWVIFTSPQTVYQTIPLIKKIWPVFPEQCRVAAIGESTAELLKKNALPQPIFPKEDWRSEGLLALPEFDQIKDKKIAILCGENGRAWLAEALSSKGATITLMIAYRRKLPKIDLAAYIDILPKIDMMICTSNEILRNLQILFQSHWEIVQRKKIIVVSERMVQYAKGMGFRKIILAKNASHDAIMSTLLQEKDRL